MIHEYPIDFYIDKLKRQEYFCLPGYSDAEFYSMMGIRIGSKTGLGQILSKEHGVKLLDVMKRRQNDPRWLFAIPKCLWDLPYFSKPYLTIDKYLERNRLDIEAYERDMILDDLAKNAGLHPFIKQLQQMDTVLIGPKEFSDGCLSFLNFKFNYEIPTPNLHMNSEYLEWVTTRNVGKWKTILVSAGVSAPIIIDRMYETYPDNFYIDCGSIWDAFVGIGGQRQWRADLYQNPKALQAWKRKNIYGT